MATNGVVSVLIDGKMAFKVVAGCDGMRAPDLALELKRQWCDFPAAFNVQNIRSLAKFVGLGCDECLVVSTPENPFDKPEMAESDIAGSTYASNFDDPQANPRWHHPAEFTEVLQLHSLSRGT